jgi:chromosome segregation ATPase
VSDAPDGPLAAVTTELRQLRAAIEQLARSQTQTQALGVYLSAQQNRLLQVSTRLDAVRKDLDAAALRGQSLQVQVANLADEAPRAVQSQRAQLEDALLVLRAEQRSVDAEVQQARSRESELAQQLQQEEARWSELISRLEQLMTK